MPLYNHNTDSILACCLKHTNINLARASYSRKVKNANSSYTVSDFYTARLPLIQDLVYTLTIAQSHTVFSEHVNLVTHQIKISIRNASDAAGLSTISGEEKAEKK